MLDVIAWNRNVQYKDTLPLIFLFSWGLHNSFGCLSFLEGHVVCESGVAFLILHIKLVFIGIIHTFD
ncbi:hypothetical protein ACJX0J_035044, partial [Zea mays]